MFILNPEQVRNKVFFYQEHTSADVEKPVPYVLVRDGYGWGRVLVSDLDTDNYGNKIITMKSKKSEKDYYWYLKDVIYTQMHGAIPEGYAVRQIEPDNFMPHNFVLRKLKPYGSDASTRFGNVEVIEENV